MRAPVAILAIATLAMLMLPVSAAQRTGVDEDRPAGCVQAILLGGGGAAKTAGDALKDAPGVLGYIGWALSTLGAVGLEAGRRRWKKAARAGAVALEDAPPEVKKRARKASRALHVVAELDALAEEAERGRPKEP